MVDEKIHVRDACLTYTAPQQKKLFTAKQSSPFPLKDLSNQVVSNMYKISNQTYVQNPLCIANYDTKRNKTDL